MFPPLATQFHTSKNGQTANSLRKKHQILPRSNFSAMREPGIFLSSLRTDQETTRSFTFPFFLIAILGFLPLRKIHGDEPIVENSQATRRQVALKLYLDAGFETYEKQRKQALSLTMDELERQRIQYLNGGVGSKPSDLFRNRIHQERHVSCLETQIEIFRHIASEPAPKNWMPPHTTPLVFENSASVGQLFLLTDVSVIQVISENDFLGTLRHKSPDHKLAVNGDEEFLLNEYFFPCRDRSFDSKNPADVIPILSRITETGSAMFHFTADKNRYNGAIIQGPFVAFCSGTTRYESVAGAVETVPEFELLTPKDLVEFIRNQVRADQIVRMNNKYLCLKEFRSEFSRVDEFLHASQFPLEPISFPSLSRVWSDSTGKFQTTGKILSIDKSVLSLEKQDGKTVDVKLSNLSRESRVWAEGYLEAVGKTAPVFNENLSNLNPHKQAFTPFLRQADGRFLWRPKVFSPAP